MNTPLQTIWKRPLPLLSATGLVAGALVLAGCGGNNATETTGTTAASNASGGNTTTVAQNADAPENSSADEAAEKTGGAHADAEHEATAHTHGTSLKVTTRPALPKAGEPVAMTLQINGKQGQPVKEFEVVHDKLMHLIVVSKDLEAFKHIHPAYKGNGRFEVTANIPQGGAYKLYADYTPKGGEQDIGTHEFGVVGGGTQRAATASLTPDPIKNGFMTRRVQAHDEGVDPEKNAPFYTVALMPMPAKLEAGKDAMLHFQVRDAKGAPVKDLQPYLGAMGHAVILSQDTKGYLHSHPMEGGHDMSQMSGGKMDMKNMKPSAPPKKGGPDVMFHTNFPKPGLYKAWGQFMHRGRIITGAFALQVGAPSGNAAGSASQGHTDAPGAAPHAH